MDVMSNTSGRDVRNFLRVFETGARIGARDASTPTDIAGESVAVEKYAGLCEPAASLGIACALSSARRGWARQRSEFRAASSRRADRRFISRALCPMPLGEMRRGAVRPAFQFRTKANKSGLIASACVVSIPCG